jgi:hypothetical protein
MGICHHGKSHRLRIWSNIIFSKKHQQRPKIAKSQSYNNRHIHYMKRTRFLTAPPLPGVPSICISRTIEISRLQVYRQLLLLLLLSKDLYSETKKVTGTLDTSRWRSFGVKTKK